jgi:aspartyl/glutamyl-tRNA(Asn/Gln) amidotransferase C subunit
VIPFPKNRRAVCPLTLAPSYVENEQLTDLKLDVGLADADRRKPEGPIEKQGIEDEVPTSDRISDSEVRHIARLARLNLEEGEIENLKKDLNSILSYVENLNELNTEDVLPMDHVLEIRSAWREDKPEKSDKAGSILSNAPEQKKGYFRVPKIIEGS